MAFKILTNVYDNQGNTYSTDVYVSYSFQDVDLGRTDITGIVRGRLTFHKSFEDKQSGFTQIQPIVSLNPINMSPTNVWSKQLTQQEITDLSNTVITNCIKEHLENIYGSGNIIIV